MTILYSTFSEKFVKEQNKLQKFKNEFTIIFPVH